MFTLLTKGVDCTDAEQEGEKKVEKEICDPYMKSIVNEINAVSEDIFDNIRDLDKYPQEVSKKVLCLLVQNVCLGQNCAPIEIGRKKIGEIANRQWLIKHFMEIADENIDYSDDWEYRRLVELVVLHVPELKENVLAKGADSENDEIREVVEDYR